MDKIKRIIREYEEIPFEGLKRGFDPEMFSLNSALTIIGPRRAGKTTYLREIIDSLEVKHFLFLNFEDERILQVEDFDLFLEAFYELYGEKPVIFLDEVQNVENWHFKVRRLIDLKYKVFLTGSNANLLSAEIATHLAGRAFIKKIMPFTFRQFLQFKRIAYSQDALYGRERFAIKEGFHEFLIFGGFPEVIRTKLKRDLLQQYFEMVFYRDLVVRHKLRQETSLRLLIHKLIENLGKSYQSTKLRNRISQIQNISKQTVFDYLRFVEESFFAVHIKNYQKSFLRRETERKTYFIDTGLLGILSLDVEPGKLLENFVFLEYCKRERSVFYHRAKRECDFVIKSGHAITEAVQVCWELTAANRDREIQGLLEALEFFNIRKGTIVTSAQEETFEIGGKQIEVQPAWKWALNL